MAEKRVYNTKEKQTVISTARVRTWGLISIMLDAPEAAMFEGYQGRSWTMVPRISRKSTLVN